jgi:Zn-dependent peptidase ImmA (M78 family)
MSELSQRLRRLRIEFGMNQSDVARQVGLSRTAVTQIESGNRDISADEVVLFSSAFRQSPASLLVGLGPAADGSATEKDRLLDEILKGLEPAADPAALRTGLERLLLLSEWLTEIESHIGVDVYGPETFVFRGAIPQNLWEVTHQGYAVAEDERRRLDLGSAPIRDVSESLATLRVRTSQLALPASTSCLYIHTPTTGPLVVVNESASLEERRFWRVHGLAHLLFEPERRWLICGRNEISRRHELRCNAFASRFLMPARGVERYLRSIGRDTMAPSLGGVLEVPSDTATVPKDKSWVRVSARSRRGGWEFNAYELSQVASYFGVTRSLAAHALRNLRFISANERDRLIDTAGEGQSDRARHALGLLQGGREHRHDAFVSRLLALVTEARRRGALARERIELIIELLRLGEEEKAILLGDAGSETEDGVTAKRDK